MEKEKKIEKGKGNLCPGLGSFSAQLFSLPPAHLASPAPTPASPRADMWATGISTGSHLTSTLADGPRWLALYHARCTTDAWDLGS